MKEPEKKYDDEDNMLVNDLRSIVSKARSKAFAAVNYSLVERNWRIGQRIVEEEQNGASRAEYGKHVIEVASAALTEEFGKGFSETNIRTFRKFFLIFNDLEIQQTLSAESNLQNIRHCLMNLLCYPKRSDTVCPIRVTPSSLVSLRATYTSRRQKGS